MHTHGHCDVLAPFVDRCTHLTGDDDIILEAATICFQEFRASGSCLQLPGFRRARRLGKLKDDVGGSRGQTRKALEQACAMRAFIQFQTAVLHLAVLER